MVSVLWNEEAGLSFEGCGEDGGEEAAEGLGQSLRRVEEGGLGMKGSILFWQETEVFSLSENF